MEKLTLLLLLNNYSSVRRPCYRDTIYGLTHSMISCSTYVYGVLLGLAYMLDLSCHLSSTLGNNMWLAQVNPLALVKGEPGNNLMC